MGDRASEEFEELGVPPGRWGWITENSAESARFPEHRHRELELNLIVSGSAYYLVDGERVELREGTLIFLFPDQRHILLGRSADFRQFIAVFSPEAMGACAAGAEVHPLRLSRPPEGFHTRLTSGGRQEVESLLRQCQREAGDGPFNTCLAYLLHRAWLIFRTGPAGSKGVNVSPAVERALQVLLREELSLEELAAAVHISPSWLSRTFRREVGMTLAEYRNRLRLDRFLQLRGRGKGENLLTLALRAGFGSYAQFHRVHRHFTGRSPRERETDPPMIVNGY